MTPDQPKRAPIVERAKWFQMTEAASVGIEIAAAIGVGALGGLWLQRNVTHWAPWTLYIGLGIGLGAAVLAIVRTARNFTRVIAAEEAAEREKSAQAHDPPASEASSEASRDPDEPS
jgi:F0F1-type ATP synthase assembly protein I